MARRTVISIEVASWRCWAAESYRFFPALLLARSLVNTATATRRPVRSRRWNGVNRRESASRLECLEMESEIEIKKFFRAADLEMD